MRKIENTEKNLTIYRWDSDNQDGASMTFDIHQYNSANARLPDNYIQLKEAMKLCARKFTPERYADVTIRINDVANNDEIARWQGPLIGVASYSRMADDKELDRLIKRVERARTKWKAAND